MGNCLSEERVQYSNPVQCGIPDLTYPIGKGIFHGVPEGELLKMLKCSKKPGEETSCTAEFLLSEIFHFKRSYPSLVTLLSDSRELGYFQKYGIFVGFGIEDAKRIGVSHI